MNRKLLDWYLGYLSGFFSLSTKQKINYFHYVISTKKSVLPYQPVKLSFVATGKCNLNCNMCPSHSPLVPKSYIWNQGDVKDLSLDTFKYTLDRFDKAIYVSIVGSGEPLLNKYIFQMIEYASKMKHMTVSTYSNGTLLNLFSKRIVNSSLKQITISINSANKFDYKRITGNNPKYYREIINNAKNLVIERNKCNSKLVIRASFLIDRHNWQYIPDIFKISYEIGVDFIIMTSVVPSPYNGLRDYEKCIYSHEEKIVSFIRDSVPKKWKRRVKLPHIYTKNKIEKKCSTHFNLLRVDGSKNYSSCVGFLLNMDGENKITDSEVWNSPFLQERRKKFLSKNLNDLLTPCKVCPVNF